MERGSVDVSYVHRYLGDAVFVYEPADCLAALQCARDHHGLAVLVLDDLACDRVALSLRTALLTYVECDRIGTACRCRVEVVVHGDKEVACSYICGSCLSSTLCVASRAEVRHAVRVSHLLRKSLVFACTAYRKVLSLRFLSSGLIAVAWNFKLVIYALRKLSCELCALLKGNS